GRYPCISCTKISPAIYSKLPTVLVVYKPESDSASCQEHIILSLTGIIGIYIYDYVFLYCPSHPYVSRHFKRYFQSVYPAKIGRFPIWIIKAVGADSNIVA